MDTTHMEYTAEDLIAHKLQRSEILVAKPKFDREGTDLIALMGVNDGAKFCRVQCKGRSLINSESSSVKVKKEYVSNTFILFLYIDNGEKDNTYLFTFFSDDIKKWHLNNDEYVLSFTRPKFQDNLKNNIFSDDTTNRIKSIIISANINEELKLLLPHPHVYAYGNETKEVRFEKDSSGTFNTIIKNKVSGAEEIGNKCPGNHKDYVYNPVTDSLSAEWHDLE